MAPPVSSARIRREAAGADRFHRFAHLVVGGRPWRSRSCGTAASSSSRPAPEPSASEARHGALESCARSPFFSRFVPIMPFYYKLCTHWSPFPVNN